MQLHQNVIGSTHAGYVLSIDEIVDMLKEKYPEAEKGNIDFAVYVRPSVHNRLAV